MNPESARGEEKASSQGPTKAKRRLFSLGLGSAVWARLRLAAFGLLLVVAGGALFFALMVHYRPVEKDVSERFVLYLEGVKPAGKLVLLTATDRFKASKDFTAKLLSLLKIEASVEISAVADTAFCIDLADTEHWKASYDPRARRLSLKAPSPGILPPAIRTDTIEVRTTGGNLITSSLFSLKKETEAMRGDLSADIAKREAEAAKDPELRSRMAQSLESLARSFCLSSLKLEPKTVEVSFFD